MEAKVEFKLHGAVCEVVAEETFLGGAEETATGNTDSRIIGRCQLNGNRYLIVCAKAFARSEGTVTLGTACQLTRREREVALMVGAGLGNKQIAHELHLSEWTVSSYLRRVFAKLGVRTRAAMVARLMCDVSD